MFAAEHAAEEGPERREEHQDGGPNEDRLQEHEDYLCDLVDAHWLWRVVDQRQYSVEDTRGGHEVFVLLQVPEPKELPPEGHHVVTRGDLSARFSLNGRAALFIVRQCRRNIDFLDIHADTKLQGLPDQDCCTNKYNE